jgi:hypothetical protein
MTKVMYKLSRRRTALVLSLLLWLLQPTLLLAQAKDQARELADIVAEDVIAERADSVYERMAPKLRMKQSREVLLAQMSAIREKYGKISFFRHRATSLGAREMFGDVYKTAMFWYSITASRCTSKCYLQVEITAENRNFYLAGYSVIHFPQKLPAFLAEER